jgi:N-acetylglucosamine kinase-like BadF-type ATPase
MGLFLAIDAGGTKTRCVLANETRVLARAEAGTVKLMRVPEAEATSRMRTMLAEVAGAAGVSLRDVTRTCFGLAGLSGPAVRAWAGDVIAECVGGELVLCGDEEIALDAAFRGGSGILVIAGTGANAIGRGPGGNLVGAGGWGPVLGDEGSGYWIGVEAVRAALRAEDRVVLGGEPTGLLREIEQEWGVSSIGELVARGNARPGPDFAALAPVVARCAEDGDALAAGILVRAGEELADLVALVFCKLSAGEVAGEVSVAFTGSVLGQIAAVRRAMVARLELAVPGVGVAAAAVDPLEGALWRARE